jgi:phospholipase C
VRDFRFVSLGLAAALLLSACSGSGASGPTTPTTGQAGGFDRGHKRTTTPLQHVVIVIQENRTFDNFFSTYPGADGTLSGKNHKGHTIPLKKVSLVQPGLSNGWAAFMTDWNKGKMNGFDLEKWCCAPGPAGTRPYTYVDPKQIAPYWTLAQQYALGDHMFQGEGSGSFTAHQELIAGGSLVDATHSLIDWPIPPKPGNFTWGCDAPTGTVTSLITQQNQFQPKAGPFPCMSYSSLADQLDAGKISWHYYSGPMTVGGAGQMWNGFDAIDAIRHGPDWSTDFSYPPTALFNDLKNGKLAAVTWVTPTVPDSDHEYGGPDHGPSWVAQVVNAIGQSPMWSSTAIIVVWDDWGGHYDHVPPPQFGFGENGFRVPLLIISPYVQAGTISHTQYEFGSILKLIEDNWGLHPVQNEDARATSIADVFHFSQKPRAFTPIKAALPRSYFEHEPITNLPGDE